jgi:microcystin-dependent protein
LSDYRLGQTGGQETVTLTQAQIPAHNHGHQAPASSGVGDTSAPAGNVPAAGKNFYSTGGPDVAMLSSTTGNAGGSQPHENRQPYLGINYIICLFGIFPSRN